MRTQAAQIGIDGDSAANGINIRHIPICPRRTPVLNRPRMDVAKVLRRPPCQVEARHGYCQPFRSFSARIAMSC